MALNLVERMKGRGAPVAHLATRQTELDREIQKYLAEAERERAKESRARAEMARLFEDGADDALQDTAEQAAKHAARAVRRAELKCDALRLERDAVARDVKFAKAVRAGLAAGEIGANDAAIHLQLVPVRASYYDARAEYEGLRQGLPPDLLRRLPELPFPMPLVLDATGNPTSPHARAAAVNPIAEKFAWDIGRIVENFKKGAAE